MYTQSFIVSAVAVLMAAQAHAAPIRARQATIPPTSIIPVGLVMDNLGNVVAPVTTVTNTNTSDLANGSNGGGGTAGSGGSSGTSGGTPETQTRKGSKAAKRGEAGDILAQVNTMVANTATPNGASMVTPGFAAAAGPNSNGVTQPAASGPLQGGSDDSTGKEDQGEGEDEGGEFEDEFDFGEDDDEFF